MLVVDERDRLAGRAPAHLVDLVAGARTRRRAGASATSGRASGDPCGRCSEPARAPRRARSAGPSPPRPRAAPRPPTPLPARACPSAATSRRSAGDGRRRPRSRRRARCASTTPPAARTSLGGHVEAPLSRGRRAARRRVAGEVPRATSRAGSPRHSRQAISSDAGGGDREDRAHDPEQGRAEEDRDDDDERLDGDGAALDLRLDHVVLDLLVDDRPDDPDDQRRPGS